ncbi:MAG: NeuD/PglB/VioB family sugar acetyltransferase [Bacteroidales bacterium]|nr:NeuD/PglB/VioB family sugar acetyltransferase [Bacteroidales bacterium]
MRQKEDIVLIGGGGHCRSVIDVIEEEGRYCIAGVVDLREKIGESVSGYKVIADDDSLERLVNDYHLYHISLGFIRDPGRRIFLFDLVRKFGGKFPVIKSPYAYISKRAELGDGTIVMHNAQINTHVLIGRNCIINSRALIEHDVRVGDNTHISTGVIINGASEIGSRCFIGSGAVVSNDIIINDNAFIKAQSLIY